MTAKRFTLKGFDGVRCDLFDGDVELAEVHKEDAKELCNLLNELAEENEQLKESVYSWSKSYNRVYEEKEQLQNELETYKSGNVVLKKTLDKYEKVMRKYELDSVEKLDQVLREQRVW